MIKAIKFLAALIGGCAVGFFGVIGGIALFTDKTVTGMLSNFSNLSVSEFLVVPLVAGLSFVISMVLHIFLHELGHLVGGLLSGYKFLSFRIFSWTLVKAGHYKIKKFSVSGTGGQCLMEVPECQTANTPVFWYNAGGVLSNLLFSGIALLLFAFLPHDGALMKMMIVEFMLVGVLFILMNGIPLKMQGISNDGHNAMELARNERSRVAFVTILRVNALMQIGVRPKDMPQELFSALGEDEVDYKNPLQANWQLMRCALDLDRKDYAQALEHFMSYCEHKDEVLGVLMNEAMCELIYLHLVLGNQAKATELYTDDIKRYVKMTRKVMSSKKRLDCAVAFFVEKDEEKSNQIYAELLLHKNDYLNQAEVAMDIDLLEDMLRQRA